jgi:hypothetical protein
MRKWLVAGASMAAALTAGAFLVPLLLAAKPDNKVQPEEPGARAAQLPIGQVMLYSSGVGFFQREGSVEGDARVDLSFPVADINDLIKSMVLRDLDGGHVSAVSYDSNAPLDRMLKSFAIDMSRNPGFAEILNQARGERVEVALSNAGSGALTGTIVGVEKQKQVVNKDVNEVQVLNLWCVDGMRGVKLSEVQKVRFLNANVDAEVKKALETLALSHDTQKKAMSLKFEGEGKRRVRVGYVIENPIWKTSYRLVMSPKGEEKPYLQGWAVVENPSDEDWKDVRMVLVSGRPISFQMDLYTPLYVQRQTVVPELFQGLRPVAYSGSFDDLGRRDADRLAKADMMRPEAGAAAAPPPGMMGGFGGGGGFGSGRGNAMPQNREYAKRTEEQLRQNLNLGRSVSSAATAAKLGDFFQYAIDRPVSLPRQKSALLPIIGKDVEASRVSIYNESVQAKFPLLGLRFKNTSGMNLMQGPVTVFEGSAYAGDARVMDLQPNEERLVSYAMDLGTEVNAVPSSENGRILTIKAVAGVVETRVKNRQVKTYTVKNRNDAERTLLVEHPVNNAFTLVGEKPKESAADVHRFEVKVPAAATKVLTVAEEREDQANYSVSTSGDDQIRFLISQPLASQKVKTGLQKALELRWEKSKTTTELGELNRQLSAILEDQTRMRANIKELPTTSTIHARLLKKFDEQETQIEKYRADIKKLQGTEHAQDVAFRAYLAGFTAE